MVFCSGIGEFSCSGVCWFSWSEWVGGWGVGSAFMDKLRFSHWPVSAFWLYFQGQGIFLLLTLILGSKYISLVLITESGCISLVLCLGVKCFFYWLWSQIQGVFLSLALVQGQGARFPAQGMVGFMFTWSVVELALVSWPNCVSFTSPFVLVFGSSFRVRAYFFHCFWFHGQNVLLWL